MPQKIKPPIRFYYLLLWAVATAARAVSAEASEAGPPAAKQIVKPDAFETLVNPNCSHCVDEAERRAGQLRDDDRVLAWIRGKYEGGAVPWRFFLVPYRVISDTYGVFVYDADAGYVRGYEPSLDFRFAGWRNGVMVLRHKDGTLYSALSGRAFDGPRRGEQLKPIATLETDWGMWSKSYPGSVAYHMFEKYQPMELPRRASADSLETRLEKDPRQIDGLTRVIGLSLNGESKAWPLAALQAAGGLIKDTLAGQKLVVLWYPPTQTAAIYAPEVEDAEPKQTLSLTRSGAWQRAAFRDLQTGSGWGIEGRALEGSLKGTTLRWLPGVQCRWFAWAAEYPETDLHAGARDTAAPPSAATPAPMPDGASPVDQPPSAVIVDPEAAIIPH